MNRKRPNLTWPCRIMLGAAMLALIAPAANGAMNKERKADDGVVFVTSDGTAVTTNRIVIREDGKDLRTVAEKHEIEVIIEDGKMTVRVDGKEVPVERVRKIRGGLVVMDEDGKEIETIRIGIAGDEDQPGFWQYWVGGEPKELQLEPAPEPKVMIGIYLDEPGPALVRQLRLEPGAATLVRAVYKGLPAQKAGLDEFDVILKIDGKTPADPDTLRADLAEKEPGDVMTLKIIHEGEPKTVKVTLAPYDAQAMAEAELIGEAPPEETGPGLFWLDKDTVMPRWGGLPADRSRLRDFFVDEQNRIFEFRPELRMKLKGGAGEDDDDGVTEDKLEARLERLYKHLSELDELLTDLLKRAEKQPHD
jgi:hypothetical protein